MGWSCIFLESKKNSPTIPTQENKAHLRKPEVPCSFHVGPRMETQQGRDWNGTDHRFMFMSPLFLTFWSYFSRGAPRPHPLHSLMDFR